MVKRIGSRVWVACSVFFAGLVALLAFRSLAVAAIASVSAGALAGTVTAGKAGAAGIHAPAFIGALMGALLQLLQLKSRPPLERMIITLVSFVAAYFGGQLAVELWPNLSAGGAGVAGTVCAYFVVPVLDMVRTLLGDVLATVRALLRDTGWIKRLIGAKAGVADATPAADAADGGK